MAPRYNKDTIITNNIWKPGRITVKYVETNPAITNWFWRPQHTIYLTITNILSYRTQSVKMAWWYKCLISQTQLLSICQDRETLTFKSLLYLRWPNTVFARAFADALFSTCTRISKNKHAVNRAILSFTQQPHYLCYFSL